jgi:transcriptional regulator with XRE-family HTH domain
MVNYVTIGGRIAVLRKAKGLTQAKLAEFMGINASTLAAYERDRRTPKADVLESIAKALGVSTAELNTEDSPREENVGGAPENNLTTLTLTREEARMILFTRINPDSMNFLQKYITSEKRERDQLEKAWRLIHEFQTQDL